MDTHHLHLHIFLDGDQQPGKDLTRAKREERKRAEESALRNFFQHKILPASFSRVFWNKGGGGREGLEIPEAHVFLQEFPVPTLLFEEVYHVCFDKMAIMVKGGKCDDDDVVVGGGCKVIQCRGEADAMVAMASAMDISNQTFAVGQDSDYLVFGYPLHHVLWSLGDVHVQYLPLDSLVIQKEEGVFGHVVTRKQVAEEFHVSEDDVVEAAILAGNDYTLFMHDLKLNKSVNFFQRQCHGKKKMKRYHLTEIMEEVSELKGFQVESSDAEQQLWIDFSRDLYHFRDISGYMDKVKDRKHVKEDMDVGMDGRSLTALQRNANDDMTVTNIDFEAFHELLLRQSELYSELPCIRSQIMAPFHELMSEDEDFLQVLRETMDVMSSDSLKYDTIPNGLEWKDYILAEVFQRSILNALRLQSTDKELGSNYAPSKIFDHLSFYHAITERNRKRIEMDDPEPTLLNPSPSLTSSVSEEARKELPIDEYRDEILSSIKDNRVTIIQGETGCGKSSRVPVMILESPPPDASFPNVKMFICQPRRIAAKSLAERVRATEPHLKPLIGLRMGHGVREYESSSTRAWFVTTGYLVRYLANNLEKFDDVTHLIIDEVHERSIDSDIICLLAKRLLQTNLKIRLVLMSATVAAELYQDYFGVEQPPIFVGARCHPINEYFVEDIGRHLQLSAKEQNALSDIAAKCIQTRCVVAPKQHYMTQVRGLAVQVAIQVGKPGSSVLIFVPGIADIVDIMESFEKVLSTIHYRVIPIHSDIPFEDQMVAFDMTGECEVKIIVATNAAESSITLPDVDHVICMGLSKVITYNKKSHRQMLELNWISRASAKQRAGRTGRVREGNVYRLYPREAFQIHFRDFEEGEILRSPLDHIILNLRTIVQSENISELLMECIEPPDMINIQNSFTSLHKKNLISEPCDEFTILPLGELIVALGIDITLGALVGFGIRFGLLVESIELAAILSSPKSPWLIPNAHLQEPEVYNGKFITILYIMYSNILWYLSYIAIFHLDLSSKTYVSKAKFDCELYSEPLSIMNLLYDFDHSDKKPSFCHKYSLSYERTRRLASTRNNLRQRVAAYLGINSASLVLKTPPKFMNKSKLLALYVLKVWLFHDGIVKLPSKKSCEIVSNHYTIQLKGDFIDEKHLDKILDKVRHQYSLVSYSLNQYNGSFIPVEVDSKQATSIAAQFEERFLSFSITRHCNLIVSRTADNVNVYIQKTNIDMATVLLDECFEYGGTIECMERTSGKHKGGDTGVYKIQYMDDDAVDGTSENLVMVKHIFKTTLKRAKTTFKQIREKLRSNAYEWGVNAILMDISNDSGGTVNIFSYGSIDIGLSKADFVSIFRTPDVTFQKCSTSSHRQAIQFSMMTNSPVIGATVVHNSPEGARIIQGIAEGRRYKRTIILKKSKAQTNDTESEVEYCEVAVHGEKHGNWVWTETGQTAVLEKMSIPATVSPQDTDIYACCANMLELQGGSMCAEGVSIIPGGKKIIELAKLCIGIGERVYNCVNDDESSHELEMHYDAVERFYNFFIETVVPDKLQFFPDGVTLLCEVFHSLDGLEMIPWTECENSVSVDRNSSLTKSSPVGTNEKVSSPLKKKKCTDIVRHQSNELRNCQEQHGDPTQNQNTTNTNKSKRNQQKFYVCLICKAHPFRRVEIRKHICVSHLGFDNSNAQIPNQCPECGIRCGKNSIYSHYMSTHSKFDFRKSEWVIETNHAKNEMLCVALDPTQNQNTTNTNKSKKRQPKHYACPICEAHPLKFAEIRRHICVSHLGFDNSNAKIPNQCPECGKRCGKHSIYDHYMSSHSNFDFRPAEWVIETNHAKKEMLCVALDTDESVEKMETKIDSSLKDTESPHLASIVMTDQEDDEMKKDDNLLSISKADNSSQFQCHVCNAAFSKISKLLQHCTVEHEKSLFDRSIAKLKTQLHNLVPFRETKYQNITSKPLYICTYPGCWDIQLFRPDTLMFHICSSHLGMKIHRSKKQKLSCSKCNITLEREKFFNHLIVKHAKYEFNVDEFKFMSKNQNDMDEIQTHDENYACFDFPANGQLGNGDSGLYHNPAYELMRDEKFSKVPSLGLSD